MAEKERDIMKKTSTRGMGFLMGVLVAAGAASFAIGETAPLGALMGTAIASEAKVANLDGLEFAADTTAAGAKNLPATTNQAGAQGEDKAAKTEIPNYTGPLMDMANLVTMKRKNELIRFLDEFPKNSMGARLTILTIPTVNGENVRTYAKRAMDTWGMTPDDMLLVIARKERRAEIVTGSAVRSKISDTELSEILRDHLISNFRMDDYEQGVVSTAGELFKLADANGDPDKAQDSGGSNAAGAGTGAEGETATGGNSGLGGGVMGGILGAILSIFGIAIGSTKKRLKISMVVIALVAAFLMRNTGIVAIGVAIAVVVGIFLTVLNKREWDSEGRLIRPVGPDGEEDKIKFGLGRPDDEAVEEDEPIDEIEAERRRNPTDRGTRGGSGDSW